MTEPGRSTQGGGAKAGEAGPGPRHRWARAGIWLGAGVLTALAVVVVFGNLILDGYGKRQLERAFTRAHPEWTLRIGRLQYVAGAHRLVGSDLLLESTNAVLKIGGLSVGRAHWVRALWGTRVPAEVLGRADLEATNLELRFKHSPYRLTCDRFNASAPDAELSAVNVQLESVITDDEFLAAHTYRATRFHLVMPECRVAGLAFGDLLRGKSYRANSLWIMRPALDALVSRDKPPSPRPGHPLMVHEALAAIPFPVQVDRLVVTNADVLYGERLSARAPPGLMTFGKATLVAHGISNRADADPIAVEAQADFMNAAALTVRMSIPTQPKDFSFHYSGALGPMDLTRLNPFLAPAEHIRIKSGKAEGAAFDIDVAAGRARGYVRATYRDLQIAVLDQQTGSERGLDNRVASFLANALRIRNANGLDMNSIKEGEVGYAKKPRDAFLQFAWFALRTGVLDVISQ